MALKIEYHLSHGKKIIMTSYKHHCQFLHMYLAKTETNRIRKLILLGRLCNMHTMHAGSISKVDISTTLKVHHKLNCIHEEIMFSQCNK